MGMYGMFFFLGLPVLFVHKTFENLNTQTLFNIKHNSFFSSPDDKTYACIAA